MIFSNTYYKKYEKINTHYIKSLENNSFDLNLDKSTEKLLQKHNKHYDPNIQKLINIYSKDPNLNDFKKIFFSRIKYFKKISNKDYIFLNSYIKKNITYYNINKHKIINYNISDLNNNELYSKYKNQITLHLKSQIKGFRTIYLPISNKCHIFGCYNNQLKDIIFLFHELGHCYQMISTKKILRNYTNAETCACINEKVMAQENNLEDLVIKLINNKILESFAMYNIYCYLISNNFSDINIIEKKWKAICKEYNIKYIKQKWMLDYNSLENPQNILSYTIAYIYALNYKNKNYKQFLNFCHKLNHTNISVKKLKNL